MDEQSKRMLLLGRQAPPRSIDLKLEPRTYVSPNHAPVADVSFRVEKHIPINDPGNKAERKAKQEVQARPAPNDHLEEFQNKVRMRAAKVQKEMREKQQEEQKQLQAKKESLDRRKAYARKVSAANSEAFRKHREAEQDSSSGSDDSDSSCDESSDGEGVEFVHTGRAPSQPSTDAGSANTSRKSFGPPTLQDPYNPPPAVKVVKGPSNEPAPVPSPPPLRKSIPAAARVKRQAVDSSGMWRPAQDPQSNNMSCSSGEEPCAPPQHVLAHVSAMQRQEGLYRGALASQMASDDPQLGTNSLGEYRQQWQGSWQPDASQQSPPHYALHHQRMHPGEAGWRADPQQTPDSRGAGMREEDYMTSPEMIALWQRQCEDLDAVREETRAASAAVSGSERANSGYQEHLGAPYHGAPYHDFEHLQDHVAVDYTQMFPGSPGLYCQAPVGRNLPSPTPSVASQPVLDREAGGGTGLAGKAAPAQVGGHWGGMLHDRTNVPAVETSGLTGDHSAWSKFAAGAAEYTDGRSDDELPLCGAFAKQHVGKGQVTSMLSNSMLQRIQQKVELHKLQLPQMCSCHDVSVLDPRYTSYCHQDCQFYANEERFSMMLKGLLETWGIIEP